MRHVPAHLKNDLDALLDLYDIVLLDQSTYDRNRGLHKAWDVVFDDVGALVRNQCFYLRIPVQTGAKVYKECR